MHNLQFNIEYPIDRVFAALTDETFIVARCIAIGADHAECDVTHEDGKTLVRTAITVSREPDKLPKMLRRFAGQHTGVLKEIWWDDEPGKTGSMSAGPERLPMHIAAQRKLSPTASGCTLQITMQVTVGIPLIGARLGRLIIEKRSAELGMEIDYLKRHLASQT